ncbi:MAG: hypothetical protein R2707_10225 [Acidimicrobiales bacterium]
MAEVARELDREALLSHFDDRTLPDGCIEPTDLAGWRRVLDLLRESSWHVEDLPAVNVDLAVLFRSDAERTTIKVFVGRHRVQVNVFPLEPTSIDFDFATAEMHDQDAVDQLALFVRSAATAAGGDCELSAEGSETDVVARYGRDLNTFGVLGDGEGLLADTVWNRAALGGGSERMGAGDQALSSALLAHGLISNGGVAHAAFDAMSASEIDASIAGFRYLGLNRAASVLASAQAHSWSDSEEILDRLDVSYGYAIPSDEQIAAAAALRNSTSVDAFTP